jgi:hypothetical protein
MTGLFSRALSSAFRITLQQLATSGAAMLVPLQK